MFLYLPVKERLNSPYIGDYCSFGIAAYKIPSMLRKPVAFVSDISVDKSRVRRLAFRCTCGQLDPIHLTDVWKMP